MGLETASYITELNASNPSGTDKKSEGDDHLRLIKTALLNSLPGFAGVILCAGVEGGSGNAYSVAIGDGNADDGDGDRSGNDPSPAAYTDRMLVAFQATHANTGAATLAVGALSAKALKDGSGADLAAGDIQSGAVVVAFYNGTEFRLVSGSDRASRAGDTYAGTHDFSAAASVSVPTAAGGDADSTAASTGFVDAWFAKKASPALTGTPTAPTAPPGTNTTQIATTAFATQLAFQAALPVQSGSGGKFLQTDGSAASWVNLTNSAAAKSADYTVLATDRYKAFDLSGTGKTLTLVAAGTAGDGFIIWISKKDGAGVWTVDGNGSTVDGRPTIKLYQEAFALICDGTNWRSFGRERGPVLISTVTIGAALANVDCEDGLTDSEFTSFKIEGDGLVSPSRRPGLRLRKAGAYLTAGYSTSDGGGIAIDVSNTDQVALVGSDIGSFSFSAMIYNAGSAGSANQGVVFNTFTASKMGTGLQNTAAAVTGVRVRNSGGNLSAGSVRHYGFR